jgi:hypothetical protein
MTKTTEIPISSIQSLAPRLPPPGTVDVTIEVVDEELGDQIQVQRLPWHALIYDESAGVLELSVGARGRSVPVVFRHEIHDPSKIWVEEDDYLIGAMPIEQEDGVRTIVRFYRRPAIEA